MLGGCIVKKVRTLGTKRWVCAILVCALLLTTPSLALAASAPEQTAAQPLTLESFLTSWHKPLNWTSFLLWRN